MPFPQFDRFAVRMKPLEARVNKFRLEERAVDPDSAAGNGAFYDESRRNACGTSRGSAAESATDYLRAWGTHDQEWARSCVGDLHGKRLVHTSGD
jgi:hypothetical protein